MKLFTNMEINNSKEKENSSLTRQLGLFDSTMMLVGITIGSGIFLTSGIIAGYLPSSGLILIAWLGGGLIILTGALTYAELGAAMPEAGGQYVYLREAYGPLFGFLFGWKMFLVSMGGAIAALAVAFAEYFSYFFPALSLQNSLFSINIPFVSITYSLSAGQLVAVAVIILLSMFNYIGVVFGKMIQNIFTVLKIGTIVLFIFLGLFFGKGEPVSFSISPGHPGFGFGQIVSGFGLALIAISWAYDGWNNLNYAAGEIKNPKRNLPYALVAGTLTITVLYVLINLVYFTALPVNEAAGVVRIAEKAAGALFGKTSAGLFSAVVLVSVFGALNGSIFVGPRVYYAMARDGLFFKKVGNVHSKFRTPGFAVMLQALWASLLALTGTFEQLFTYATFLNILFWVGGTAAVFTLRKKFPDLPRPYKTWGYPVVPMVFIIAFFGVLINTLIEKPVESLIGLFFTLLGIPIFYLWKQKSKPDKEKF
ncbi:APC family permease [candidate division KSB1 bacterium]